MRKRKGAKAKALRREVAATGTITLATVGLATCTSGCGVNDPVPPPPLTCKEANHGQNIYAEGSLDSTALNIRLWPDRSPVDTVYVSSMTGASVDSLVVDSPYPIRIYCTLDSLDVKQVKFTVRGTWSLESGPCNFQRTFTARVLSNGELDISRRETRLPLDVPRDVHIELVDRDGLRVNLRAAVAGEGTPEWRATAGKLERVGRLDVTWELPPDPGFYQIELSVDRGTRGIGFDALALEVS